MALANADRASDLQALDLRYLNFTPEGAKFQLVGLTKTARANKSLESFYPVYDQEEILFPVQTLQHYLSVTKELRVSSPGRQPLFLAVIRPHPPITTATIARWLKEVLQRAGVSQDFKAHSTRCASVSVAFDKGVAVADIMRTADWSLESTFSKFYYKPERSQSRAFGEAVLSSK